MIRKSGIPLIDLFDVTDQINSALPQVIQDFLDRFSVIGHRTTRSPGAIFHHGKVQPLSTAIDDNESEIDIGIGKLSIPLIHGGVPFQFSMARATIVDNLEPAAQSWQLDLHLTDFALTLDGLEPAIYVVESGTTPRHLLRDDTRSNVRIIGSAVLRLEKPSPDSNIEVKFVDQTDPLDPTLESGAVAELNFSPPHFFLGTSEIGLSVGRIQFDFSKTYSPPNILERNQGAAWVGLAIREATVYAPRNLPVVGDLSGGVKNVLFGRPMGIQGEFELQFGRTALNPETFQFQQAPDVANRGVSGSGTSRIVSIEAGQEDSVIINAGFTVPAPPTDGTLPNGALQDWKANWVWPDGSSEKGDSSIGTIRHGQVLRVEPIEIVTVDSTPTEFNHPEITFRFVAQGEAPKISASLNANSFANLIHLNGTAVDIGTLTLTAISTALGNSQFEWEVLGKNTRETGVDFLPDLTGLTNQQWVILRETVEGEESIRLTRLHIQITEDDTLLVGCEDGVFDASDDSTSLELSAVEATFDLSDFHAQGVFIPNLEQAILDSSEDANVDVPPDSLAQVTIFSGATPDVEYDRHIQIEMLFEEAIVTRWGDKKPAHARAAANVADLQSQLLDWVDNYPDADFLVIGRCDDIGSGSGEYPDSFNIDLAKDRASKGRELLTTLLAEATGDVVDSSQVYARGESSVWDITTATALEENSELAMSPAEKSGAVNDVALVKGWLIKYEYEDEHAGWVNDWDKSQSYESIRQKYRRVDIYAVNGTPTVDAIIRTGEPEVAPTLRRSMVPADDRMPTAVPSSAPAIDYRVKLRIVWDSPTVTEWKDAIPTIAEAEFVWTPQEMPLPEAGGEAVELSRETLTVYANWVQDASTGFTRTTLGLRSDGDPNGLAWTDNKTLTAAAAFGPMLLSGVDLENDLIGSGARMAALIGASTFATTNMPNVPLVGDGSKTSLISVEAQAQTRAISDPTEDYQIKLTADYVCTLHINAGALGLKTAADKPMKVRYKNVGLEFDNSAEGWNKFGIAYETDSMEIEDSGKWEINGVLGSLLRIVEISFGRGSLWIEGRIAIAINIGVVEISEAIIRLTWKDGDPIPVFELRGFVLKADIPNVLTGEGRLRIEDSGVIRAGVEANVIPLGLGASAGIAFGKPPEIDPSVFLELFLGVQFSTPLPLGQSGAAIYGFKGQFTMNGSRKLGSSQDPVKRELDWWSAPPGTKYKPDDGQYAIGLGVVVGTMPDVSFAFSASGMLVVAFPDPEVILGVDVKIIEVPVKKVSDEGSPEGAITGLIIIDDEAVKVAVSAQYEIPKILKLKVPFGAYFPYSLQGTYVRLGSDGQNGRHGEPITITFLPDTLNQKAWSYLMIEQDGLPSLGGVERFSFDGFAVGFGAGWGIKWEAGPIKLSASAKVLVGFGTNPLLIKGGVFVVGELDLVVVSISARGELILTYFNEDVYLEGKFCGEVDLFFFSIEGCVGVVIGEDECPEEIPAPESPVTGISLVDRRDRIMGSAVPTAESIEALPIFSITNNDTGGSSNQGVSPSDNNTVWPDTAPVLHFSHYIKNSLEEFSQFRTAATPTQPEWFGSNNLKYTYRLDKLMLRRKSDGVLVAGSDSLLTAWMTTPYRQNNSSGESNNPLPSEHEGPNLKLLDWNPWNWVVNMDNGAEETTGDPAKGIEEICDPVPHPSRACVFGRASRGAGWYSVRMRQETVAPPPYPSRFSTVGGPVLRMPPKKVVGRDLMTLATAAGATIYPGFIADLPFAVSHGSEILRKGYRLPTLRKAVPGGMVDIPLPWEAQFDRELARPSVTLMICDAPGQAEEWMKECTEFEGVKPSGKTEVFTHKGMIFRSLDSRNLLILVDEVDTNTTPENLGSDGKAEIMFGGEGMDITFPHPCSEVELAFMKLGVAEIKIEAEDASGRIIDVKSVNGPKGVPIIVRLNAPNGILLLRIFGGAYQTALFRICCTGSVSDTLDLDPEKICEDFRLLKPSNQPFEELEHEGYRFTPMREHTYLSLIDAVDQSSSTPIFGKDNSAEIQFPSSGMKIELPHPCEAIELWVMLFTKEAVHVIALDADEKEIASAISPVAQRISHRLELRPSDGKIISQIIVMGGGFESVVFRICCLGKKQSNAKCMTFEGLKFPTETVVEFKHKDYLFEDIIGKRNLSMHDRVNAKNEPVNAGRDRLPEISFGERGIRITLPNQCDHVTIGMMLFGKKVRGQALNALGARVDTDETTSEIEIEQVLEFNGPDIRVIELFGGNQQAMIYEICCTEALAQHDLLTHDLLISDQDENSTNPEYSQSRLSVRGIVEDRIVDQWFGKLIQSQSVGKRICEVVQFEPEAGTSGPWNGFQVKAPRGKEITILSICGIDQIMVDRRNEDADNQSSLQDEIAEVVATDVENRREILLEPGEKYEIVVEWSYQYWESKEGGTDKPPASPVSDDWKAGTPQTFHFAVAIEELETGNTQDGLNEYVFDARDVNRHLILVEPEDGRAVHFTDDPIWAHFDAGHMEQLLDQYGRKLQIEVCRTDPPPQSTPGALSNVLAPLPATALEWMNGPASLQPKGYQRLNAALESVPCLPDGPVVGGASLAAQFELEPNAMYDLRILAPKTDGSQPSVVTATRFLTSRYSGPNALMNSLGYATDSQSPYRPDDILLSQGASLPSGVIEEVSDSLLDELMSEMGVDTLPLPRMHAVSYAVWSQSGKNWELEGLLIDSLESLNRTGAIQSDSGSEIMIRCKIKYARVKGHSMTVFRANENWTRVFLKPENPIALLGIPKLVLDSEGKYVLELDTGGKHKLELDFETSEGIITGSCTISGIPAIIDREGL